MLRQLAFLVFFVFGAHILDAKTINSYNAELNRLKRDYLDALKHFLPDHHLTQSLTAADKQAHPSPTSHTADSSSVGNALARPSVPVKSTPSPTSTNPLANILSRPDGSKVNPLTGIPVVNTPIDGANSIKTGTVNEAFGTGLSSQEGVGFKPGSISTGNSDKVNVLGTGAFGNSKTSTTDIRPSSIGNCDKNTQDFGFGQTTSGGCSGIDLPFLSQFDKHVENIPIIGRKKRALKRNRIVPSVLLQKLKN